jgi:hypothetical protein
MSESMNVMSFCMDKEDEILGDSGFSIRWNYLGMPGNRKLTGL